MERDSTCQINRHYLKKLTWGVSIQELLQTYKISDEEDRSSVEEESDEQNASIGIRTFDVYIYSEVEGHPKRFTLDFYQGKLYQYKQYGMRNTGITIFNPDIYKQVRALQEVK